MRERERERERESKGGDCEFLNVTNQEFEKDFRERETEKKKY